MSTINRCCKLNTKTKMYKNNPLELHFTNLPLPNQVNYQTYDCKFGKYQS